jgi:hypothetical protein
MKKIHVLLCLACLLLLACENWVEVDNPTNQIGTAQVFEDLKTAYAALAGLYAPLRDRSMLTGGSYVGIGPLAACYADDLDCYYYDQNGVVDIFMNQQQETNTTIKSFWESAYQQIYYANAIIHGAEQSTALADNDKDQIKGEALLLRSLIYFYLQQLFDEVPYTTSLNYEHNRQLSKMETSHLLELLELDLTEAIGLLEDEYRDVERIFPNRKAAQLMLARVYLHQGNWAMAEETAQSVLLSPLYQFQTDINAVFHKTGSHILWQLKPQNSGDAVSEASFYYFTNSAPNSFVLTQDLVQAFAEEDLRRQNWMTEVVFNEDSWFRPDKYKSRENNAEEYSVVFRLAEVSLLMAEALGRQERYEEALPYLNATRERAGLTALTALSGDDFFNELLAERRREFFSEAGHRFLDLKRFGRLGDLGATKPNWKAHHSAWPLPQSELLLNVQLKPQNNGY